MSTLLPLALLSDATASRPEHCHVVLALCADWCGTCRSFRPVLEQLAAEHPHIVFSWLDIEDEADLANDLDVETFPTLAIFRDGAPLYFGASLPMADVVTKLIRAAEVAGGPLSQIPREIAAMADALFASEADRAVLHGR
ncbi:MAG: thioredoxin [Betaproteobacteria bacterium HGW-Betaproteobacteria-13]|jgi:thioredoxin reductase (NADPH)|nr:MAG: thioredoxin [Betaproteobacteria bacterium HGW-Betaproteobacteria-19]PKO82649.1 MAG: thioredoxin [Betaproteobacteria bacterium HGW-Betaproteobacteria-13]